MKNNQLRATGASCKECRRLKIKCDKMVPCGTCTKRGLQSLCPDGQLSGAKGSRYVLATAEESWNRIQALCVRVQDLEFALERAHSLVANDKHPLLEEDLIKIGQDPRAVIKKTAAGSSEDVPIANLGTVKVSKSGSYRWLGVGGVVTLTDNIGHITHTITKITALPAFALDDYDDDDEDDEDEGDPSEMVFDSQFTHERIPGIPGRNLVSIHDLKVQGLQQLPPRQRMLQLIDSFFENYMRWSTILTRPTVIDTLFTVTYDGDATSLSTYNICSLLCIVALGLLCDQPRDPTGREFKVNQKWAKTLFFSAWPKGPSTIDEFESLLLLHRVLWLFMDADTTAWENYELVSWGVKLGEKIGLNRDPGPLNLPPEECLRRRRVFWNLWFQDTLASLVFGQPPTLSKGFVDCKPPDELNMVGFEDLNPRSAVIMQDILTHFFESKVSPPYTAVLLIDQKIRDIGVATHIPSPSVLSTVPLTQTAIPDEASSIYCRGLRSVLLLALHRTYFSHAISRPNENPVTGRMGKSIIAVFEAATDMLETGLTSARFTPWMQAGQAPIWMQCHTAVLVLYAFPTYLPYWQRSEEAMKTADTSITSLFKPNAPNHEHIANCLPSLLKAQKRAQQSFVKYKNGQWTHPTASGETHEQDLKQDFFLNDKFVIVGSADYDTSGSNTPGDYPAPPPCSENIASSSTYQGNWQTDGQIDKTAHYKNAAPPDWTHALAAIPTIDSSSHFTGLYPSHHPFQSSLRPPTTLQMPGEVIGVPDHRPDRQIPRARGLSRARSFPSDHPAGYSSTGYAHTQTFQPLQVPSPTTPVDSTVPMHPLGHPALHEPHGRWIQSTIPPEDPYKLPTYILPSNVSHHTTQMSLTDAGAIPIHVLDPSWNSFSVQPH